MPVPLNPPPPRPSPPNAPPRLFSSWQDELALFLRAATELLKVCTDKIRKETKDNAHD